jgi:nickel-dependent lactate racemase
LPETRSRQETDEFRLKEFAMNEVLDTAKSLVTVFAGLFIAVGVAVGGLALVLNLVKLAIS